jgi:hypothetical protein
VSILVGQRAESTMATQMSRDWEARFTNWKGKASDSEEEKYKRTSRSIGEALRGSDRLSNYEFDVYAKGSYPNFTNVVRDSDVDVAVELTTYRTNRFIHAAEGLTIQDLGLTPYTGDATLAGFKDDVEHALIAHFGAGSVDRGSKAIRIAENSGRLPADVVPCVTERTWTSRTGYNDGIRLHNDRNPTERIVNYPKQHLKEGTTKNDATSRRYKRVVRILKRLENEMVDEGVIGVVPSFLIESLVWSVPNSKFEASTWKGRVRAVLAHIFNETRNDGCVTSDNWLEANAIKFLFWSGQNWSYEEAHEFASKAWDYVGFE